MASTPQDAAAAWVSGLSSKTTKMENSARAVTVAPGTLAARQKAVWLANLQASAGRWEQNVQRVSAQQWADAYVTKGIPRIASGAQAAQAKMEAAMAQLLPHIERVRASLPPRGTYEQNKARANAMMDGMHGFRMQGSR